MRPIRWVALLAASMLSTGAVSSARAQARAGEFRDHGVYLPSGAVKIGGEEDRYRLQENLDAALKWYRGVYRPEKYPRKLIVNQPGIKAIHIENPDPKGEWSGFNIYSYQGETRIYVLERDKTER